MILHVNIPDQRVEELLFGHSMPAGACWWGEIKRLKSHHYANVTYTDRKGDGEEVGCKKAIYLDDVARGLALMAEKYPHHFEAFIKGNDDSFTCDAAWQMIVYNDIVFG